MYLLKASVFEQFPRNNKKNNVKLPIKEAILVGEKLGWIIVDSLEKQSLIGVLSSWSVLQ